MNRRMKLIESYLLLLADVVSITLAYTAAILLRFKSLPGLWNLSCIF